MGGLKQPKIVYSVLEDVKGNKMAIIKHDEHTAEAITNEVFRKWINGDGMKPRSWATLATVLDDCNLCALSEEICSTKAIPGKSEIHPL